MRVLRAAVVAVGILSITIAPRVLAVSVPGYAILGAKIVTVHGATIDQGTVVIRNGVVESVADGVKSPGGVEEIAAPVASEIEPRILPSEAWPNTFCAVKANNSKLAMRGKKICGT